MRCNNLLFSLFLPCLLHSNIIINSRLGFLFARYCIEYNTLRKLKLQIMYYVEYKDIKAKKKLCKTSATKTKIDKAIIVKDISISIPNLCWVFWQFLMNILNKLHPSFIVLLLTLNIF